MTLLIGHQKYTLDCATRFDDTLKDVSFCHVWLVALCSPAHCWEPYGLGWIGRCFLCCPRAGVRSGALVRLEERPVAPLLEGAGTARVAGLTRSPRAFVKISIYSQKMNTDTVILYPFLFKGVIDAF